MLDRFNAIRSSNITKGHCTQQTALVRSRFVNQSFGKCMQLERLTGGTPRFDIDENNQKTSSRIASASANKLYHRILDTSTPRTCSAFASLRDATPHERHICRGLFGRTLPVVPWRTLVYTEYVDASLSVGCTYGYYYRGASVVRCGNTPAYFRFCRIIDPKFIILFLKSLTDFS